MKLVLLACLVTVAVAFPNSPPAYGSYGDAPYLTIQINRPESNFDSSVSKSNVVFHEKTAEGLENNSQEPHQPHVPPFLAFNTYNKPAYAPAPYAPVPPPYN